MFISAVALAVLPTAACSASRFEEFVKAFGKSYAADEVASRRELFEQRLQEVEELNARPGATWVAGVSRFSDMHLHEMRRYMGYDKSMGAAGSDSEGWLLQAAAVAVDLPGHVDWRERQPAVVSPVKDQGACGSCWAFSAAESMESHIAIATGVLLSLSPQHLTSCVPNPNHCGGLGGCRGATAQLAFNYTVGNKGLNTIWHYPYNSGVSGDTGECNTNGFLPGGGITAYVEVPKNDARALMETVAVQGPVSISVDAGNWYLYHSGIFDHCNKTNPDINHAVQLVGYGREKSIKYWLVRNSWGVNFGEDGYIRIRRYDVEACGLDIHPEDGSGCEGGPTEVEACGECGILFDSAYPMGGWVGAAKPVSHPEFKPPGTRRLRGEPPFAKAADVAVLV